MAARVYVEEWADGLGQALSIEDGLAAPGTGEPVELPHRGALAVIPDPSAITDRALAFVDGVRRVDVPLQAHLDDGRVVFGIAGSHAHGTAIARTATVELERLAVERLVIWGCGETIALRSRTPGIAWDVRCVDDAGPDAPLAELQQCMRKAEGRLAESLMDSGALVVCDGPLNYVLAGELPICGYVKTHQFAHLPAEQHREIPRLAVGERSVIFKTAGRERRYSAYMRIGARDLPYASPWRGIVRLEVPQARGLDVARQVIDELTQRLGAFGAAGHKDARAPVNLRPIAALEKRLRHRLGHPRLIAAAARHAALETRPRPARPVTGP